MLLTYFWAGIGGAIGTVARLWLTVFMVDVTGPRYPWGTLLINVLGSFVIGLAAGLTLTPERVSWPPDARVFLMTGICGGFTTFSAFSLQAVDLIRRGEPGAAAVYALASVLACLGATAWGFAMARA